MRFVWGVIWIIIGILMMRYNFQLVQIFGKIGWAEEHMSSGLGGTYLMYKLVGLFIIIAAMLYMVGGEGAIFGWLGPVFGGAAK